MAVPTVNVTVTVYEQDGSPVEGCTVQAELVGVDRYNNQFVGPIQQQQATDANGQAVLALFPNALGERNTFYRFKATHPTTNKKYIDVTAVVPNANVALTAIENNVGQMQEPWDPANQPYSAQLTSFASLVGEADKLPYFTGASSFALADFTSFGRSVVAAASAAVLAALLAGTSLSVADLTVTTGQITSGSTTPLSLATSGGEQVRIAHTASVVNYVNLLGGSTGIAPTIGPQGADAAGSLALYAKGAGNLKFRTRDNNDLQFQIDPTTSAVNYWVFTGAATAGQIACSASGTDADVSLRISARGTSPVDIFTAASSIRALRVTHIASAVNYLDLRGAATGALPGVYASGTDTNIGLGYRTKGSAFHFFYSDGGSNVQASIARVLSSVNYTEAYGAATTAAPASRSVGSDTNVAYELGSKGTGRVFFTTSNTEQVRITHRASATQYLDLTGGETAGSPPTVSPGGSDTNVGLSLMSKGSSSIRFWTDSTGTPAEQFRITHTASAVNYWSMTGSITAGSPTFLANGSDANVPATFVSRGSGDHRFSTNSAGTNVQARVSHVASAVNYEQIFGAATAGAVGIGPAGTDTDIQQSITSKGAGAVSFFTNGYATGQFRITHTASAVNYLQTTGNTTGNTPVLRANGTDANITTRVASLGTGNVEMWTDYSGTAARQFQARHNANSANYVYARGAPLGGGVLVGADGSDSNINISLSTRGSGVIRMMTTSETVEQARITHIASAVNYSDLRGAATGGLPAYGTAGSDTNIPLNIFTKGTASNAILLSPGSVEQARVVYSASAVNSITLTGSPTGNAVTISAQGSDADVPITIVTKGGGNLRLDTGTGDIRIQKALVALGGGAAPTLGTIGGSGPTVAGQNSWLRLLDSTGAAFWVPAWK
jgi:hypothetical protein